MGHGSRKMTHFHLRSTELNSEQTRCSLAFAVCTGCGKRYPQRIFLQVFYALAWNFKSDILLFGHPMRAQQYYERLINLLYFKIISITTLQHRVDVYCSNYTVAQWWRQRSRNVKQSLKTQKSHFFLFLKKVKTVNSK